MPNSACEFFCEIFEYRAESEIIREEAENLGNYYENADLAGIKDHRE